MTIDTDRILTCSAREYVESVEKKLSNYEMRGVHLVNSIGYLGHVDGNTKVLEALLTQAPSNAEVIVDYRDSLSYNGNISGNHETTVTISAHGVALIPKGK